MGGRTWLSLSIAVLAAIFLAGCSGSTSTGASSTGPVPVSMTIRDTPPSGVTILSFEIHITGASLQPSGSAPAVSLVSQPEEIELEHLQTTSALVGNANVAAGTYNSLKVTFANPQMTILNNSGGTLSVGGTSCANGQICELQPSLNQVSDTLTSSPFPLTLSANSPVSLNLDFNLDSSVQNNLSVTPVITVSSVNTSQASGSGSEQEDSMEFFGLVTAVQSSNQSFTLQEGLTGQTETIVTNSNTEFDFGNMNCQANDFSCIATGDLVKVEAQSNNGTLTAQDVEGLELPKTNAVTGTVVSANSAPNQFQIVLQDIEDSTDAQTLTLGLPVTVSVQTGATFNVDAGGLSLGGLTFNSLSNLIVGQEVTVAVTGVQTGTSGILVNTDQVTLEMSQISGTAGSVSTSAGTFTLSGLSSLFTTNSISQILVQTSSNTEYENVSGLSALGSLSGSPSVSVSGLLFMNSSNQLELLASKVLLRQN